MTRRWMVFFALLYVNTNAFASMQNYQFTVFLNGNEIGQHRFEFEGYGNDDSHYRLTSEARYQVKILFVTVYEYQHLSVESWRDGCLEEIASTTTDNGENYQVVGARSGDQLAINVNGDGRITEGGCIRTFAYWNLGLLQAGNLLNSQTGELEKVELEDLGRTPLPWDTNRVAETIALESEQGLIRLWYSEDGIWLGLSSELQNGRVLEYRLNTEPTVALEIIGLNPDAQEWSL